MSFYTVGDATAHEREYHVETDSTLVDRGCFADSFAIALGTGIGWVYRHSPAFTLTHVPDSSLVRLRRTPHVIAVWKTVTFHIDDTIRRVP